MFRNMEEKEDWPKETQKEQQVPLEESKEHVVSQMARDDSVSSQELLKVEDRLNKKSGRGNLGLSPLRSLVFSFSKSTLSFIAKAVKS